MHEEKEYPQWPICYARSQAVGPRTSFEGHIHVKDSMLSGCERSAYVACVVAAANMLVKGTLRDSGFVAQRQPRTSIELPIAR